MRTKNKIYGTPVYLTLPYLCIFTPFKGEPYCFSNTCNMHILYVMSGQSLWIVLTWFDKLLYPVWINLVFSVHKLYSWIRRWWDFHSHSTVQRTVTQHAFNIREQFCLWTKCTEFSYSCSKGIISTQKELCKAFFKLLSAKFCVKMCYYILDRDIYSSVSSN
jgi:hypothetical protein